MNNPLIVIVILGSAFALFALIGWIVLMDSRRRQANFRAATEFRHKLLDKFSTATEFIEFIKADEGQRFLNLPTEGRPGPLDRVLRFVQTGVVLMFVGLSLAAGALATPGPPGAGTIIGVSLGAAGLGALVAAGISYRLLKKWGVIKPVGQPARGEKEAAAATVSPARSADASTEAEPERQAQAS